MSRIFRLQAIYLLAFAALHSLLASRPVKSLAWGIFGQSMDRRYTTFFSVFAAITFAPLALLFLLSPGKRLYVVPSPWRWLMVGAQLLAGIITILAFKDAPHRFLLGQQLNKSRYHEPLNPRGIYRFVRDPFLLSGLMQMWMMPIMTTKLLLVFAIVTIYLVLGSLHWETRLKYQFRQEYEDYKKQVPRINPLKRGRHHKN
jgi:protein-S-isoprenylcysteine O-methyltransferase Ste14